MNAGIAKIDHEAVEGKELITILPEEVVNCLASGAKVWMLRESSGELICEPMHEYTTSGAAALAKANRLFFKLKGLKV